MLREQGIPPGRADGRIVEALGWALERFAELAEPAGIRAEVTKDEFGRIFKGAGRNAARNPLADIYQRAERLALFAVTVGPRPEQLVARLFKEGKFELGYLLDAVASSAADRLAGLIERSFGASGGSVSATSGPEPRTQNPEPALALRYSPGYCGWDLTGQRALFRRLKPTLIGIKLRRSCLMEPLKSVSGVVVLAAAEAHRFNNDFPFCPACATRTCRGRIAALPRTGQKPRRHEKHEDKDNKR